MSNDWCDELIWSEGRTASSDCAGCQEREGANGRLDDA